MKTIHTILREDFGQVDRDVVRTELLRQAGICAVHCGPARNELVIEYDAGVLDHSGLFDIMCRAGVLETAAPLRNLSSTNIGDG
jgi:hypothetical protein